MALPSLLDGYATPNLIKRLTQLWWADSHANAEAQNTVAEYHKLAAALDDVKAYNEQRHTALLAENHKLAGGLAAASDRPVTPRALAGQVARRILPGWVLRLLRPDRS